MRIQERAPFRRRAHADPGISLVEMVVSIALLGVVVVALLAGLTTAIATSSQHRKLATADTLLRSAAEIVSAPETPYVACASTTTYGAALPNDPTGQLGLTVTMVEHWNGSGTTPSFSATCSPDTGLQRITLQARSIDNKQTETVQVVKRRTT